MATGRNEVRRVGAALALACGGAWGQTCDRWERVDDGVPVVRTEFACGYDSVRGVTVLFGGTVPVNSSVISYPNELWEWDGRRWRRGNDRWTKPQGRVGHSLAFDPSSATMWMDGGSPTYEWNTFTRLWKLEPDTGWVAMSPPATRPNFQSCSRLGLAYFETRNSLLRVPLCSIVNLPVPSGSIAEINAEGVATGIPPLNTATGQHPGGRNGPSLLTIPTGEGERAWLYGGQKISVAQNDTWIGRFVGPPDAPADSYDWVQVGDTTRPPARTNPGVVYDSVRNVVVLAGGNAPSGGAIRDVWEFDYSTLLWRQADNTGGPAIVAGTLSFHPSTGETFAFGEMRYCADTGQPDVGLGVSRRTATGWAQVESHGPGPRFWTRIAYEPGRDRTILIGGINSEYSHFWSWNGSGWDAFNTSNVATRYLHAVVYDRARGRMLLFGGRDSAAVLGDTQVLQGDTWVPVAVPGPPARRSHAMVYDSARSRVLLFGGNGSDNRPLGDTWEWTGEAWRQLNTPGPPARFMHAMAYDSREDRVVLFGGLTLVGTRVATLDDTWEFDGARWERIEAPGPGPRQEAGAAYDEQRGMVVLFGGGTPRTTTGNYATPDNELWSYRRGHWTRHPETPVDPRRGHGITYDSARAAVLIFGGDAGVGDGKCDLVALRADADLPEITADPVGTLGVPGGTVSLAVSVAANGGASVAWYKDGVPLQNSARIEGADTERLTIRETQAADSGRYWAAAQASCGRAFSQAATVLVRRECDADLNQDGSVDGGDVEWFFRRWEAGSPLADLSGDGATDGQDIGVFFAVWEAGGC